MCVIATITVTTCKPSLIQPIEEVTVDQDGLQDCAEPGSALPAEQPPRPQRQTRQTRSKSKDSKVPPASGANKNGGEADQKSLVESVLSPVQVADTVTQLTNSPGTHEVSCLCGLPENAKEGLLLECDSCKKWVHCKCYMPANLEYPKALRLGCLVGVAPVKLLASHTHCRKSDDSQSETALILACVACTTCVCTV